MKPDRKRAIIVGVLFLLGFAGVFGPVVVKPILEGPSYLVQIAENENRVLVGALFQVVMALACAGIAIGLYPVLKKQNKSLALGAVGFRIIENMLIVVSALGLLLLLTLSQDAAKAGPTAASGFQAVGSMLLGVRFWSSLVLAGFGWVLGALMYYYILYRSNLIPRWLSGWGLVAIVLHLASVFVTMFTQVDPFSGSATILMNIPAGLQELVLAVWLIVKGFNPAALASLNAKAANELPCES